tara:strand:+ start:252 stop:398 length:147 start_codon:yes stop_codon:yes gene_type:complete
MKQYLKFIFLFFYFGCNISSYDWFDGTLEEAKSIAEEKLIMLKFYTNT